MQTPTLGEARLPSPIGHKVSDDIRIPERIVPGADPGLLFELAGPREKLFFNPKETVAGIVTCGGLCPGLNNVIRSLFFSSKSRLLSILWLLKIYPNNPAGITQSSD